MGNWGSWGVARVFKKARARGFGRACPGRDLGEICGGFRWARGGCGRRKEDLASGARWQAGESGRAGLRARLAAGAARGAERARLQAEQGKRATRRGTGPKYAGAGEAGAALWAGPSGAEAAWASGGEGERAC